MRTLTAKQAAEYCKQNKFRENEWSCGYILEVSLEVNANILLENEESWTELENILFYNN